MDPSPAMLDMGRRKLHGKEVEWVQSSAQTYRSAKLFDLVIMTGHAFQVLLEDADILATFETMRQHVQSGGVVAFESRNPAIDWAKRWTYDMMIDLPGGGVVRESRRFRAMEHDRLSFELRYQFRDEIVVSESELRFMSREGIEDRLRASGLRVDRVLGGWDAAPFDETSSCEMIFIAHAPS